ncbi:LPS export ABC transporter periplasmic protein LptC [Pseudogulbenkiania subflava]|uniref:Lipopolysaccharide export system protein LptC n=1 Tax=Pseudogulbenkiania subflava DSM 22618 TaxID=1123014 RepID=A0A1Y6BSZ1_9NEIS|nr:LPS export ABC transporter periplasmic protein LptC [Pseudogulbenkiania subflava]SMF19961.1 lipopolysaccharide export system protein LptC [Pseudogulbenkiania subflava DSM 22618]
MILRAQRLFPIVLLALTGLLTFWLDQISRWTPETRALDPNKPEFVAEHFTALRYDTTGKVQDQLSAQRMWQYPGKDDLFFDAPALQIFAAGVLQYDVRGQTGRYNNKTRQAFFDRQVTLFKPADAQRPETRVDTSVMYVDLDKRLARSAAPVTIHYGTSVARSVGFTYDQRAGLLKLLSNARVVYAK